jgi:hypothetical protein
MTSDSIARGQRAAREFAEVEAAFDAVREAAIKRLFDTKISEGEQRERLYLAVQNLGAVRKAIRLVIDDGHMQQAADTAAQTIAQGEPV